MKWHLAVDTCYEDLGLIPAFLNTFDPRPAAEQIHEHYAHGGGWRPFQGFELDDTNSDPLRWMLTYPGDPSLLALAYSRLREETIVLFTYSWLLIVTHSSWQIARID